MGFFLIMDNCAIRFGAPEENQLWGRHIMTLALSVLTWKYLGGS